MLHLLSVLALLLSFLLFLHVDHIVHRHHFLSALRVLALMVLSIRSLLGFSALLLCSFASVLEGLVLLLRSGHSCADIEGGLDHHAWIDFIIDIAFIRVNNATLFA